MKTYFALSLLALGLAACTAPPASTLTPTVSATPRASATPRVTATRKANATFAVKYVTATATPTPLGQLSRKPTLSELNVYLTSVVSNDFYGFEADDHFFYQDLNGDGEKGLVVGGLLQVVVLLWHGDRYGEPFYLSRDFWKYDSASKITLQDWTQDSLPEVIFDYRGDTGGTGIGMSWWGRSIIHCGVAQCQIVWQEKISSQTDDHNAGGMDLFSGQLRQTVDAQGRPALRQLQQGFSLNCCSFDGNLEEISKLRVFTSTLSLYSWNGAKFELTEQSIVSLPYTIASKAKLMAENAEGTVARIQAKSNFALGQLSDVCQLTINGVNVGQYFGCDQEFTQVEWRDLAGDAVPEIMITAFSALHPIDGEGNELTKTPCSHQHLLAYQWDGQKATLIADVMGCVVRPDLYGVRLEDFDHAGQVEILAADSWHTQPECAQDQHSGCWYEIGYRHQIYKWNGAQFVFWDDVPGE